MSPEGSGLRPPSDSSTGGATSTRRIRPVAVLLTIIVALLAAMWIYALFFASKEAAYRVDDPAWRENAERICSRYQAQRLELVDTEEGYIAEPTPEQMIERADLVDQATDLLEAQLDELIAELPPSDEDRQLVADFEGYWRIVLADRRAYTERLRALDLQPYLETKVDGGPVTNLLVDFSVVNLIKSCSPPNELGGDT
jgi:hypothetical protein